MAKGANEAQLLKTWPIPEVPHVLPGRVLSVWEPDMSDGATGTKRHNLVSVTFTVR